MFSPLDLSPARAVAEATALRAAAWGEYVPVDPVLIARRLGVRVVSAKLDSHLAGALLKEVGRDPVLLLNADDHPYRQRVVAANLLGHLVAAEDPERYEHVATRASIWGALADRDKDPEESKERFANVFAASLLGLERSRRPRLRRGRRADAVLEAARLGVPVDSLRLA